jgi:glycine/D-amino acid oxidase-like deaminating enzyme
MGASYGVAASDSGHAVKFAPVLGAIIADALKASPTAGSSDFEIKPDTLRPERGRGFGGELTGQVEF